MKIAIVTVWYNEEDLAPFFLKHYSYVDDLYVYLDTATSDSTRKICEAHSNVTIRDMSFPAGYDPAAQVRRVTSAARVRDRRSIPQGVRLCARSSATSTPLPRASGESGPP